MAFIMSMIIILYLNSEQCSGQNMNDAKFRCETCVPGRSQGKYDCRGCVRGASDAQFRKFGCRRCISNPQTRRDELSRHTCRRCSNTEPSQMTYNSCPACPIPNNCIAGSKRWQLWSCDTNTWEPGYCTAYTGFDGQTGYNCDRCDRETIWGKLLEQSIRTVPCIFR